MYHCKAHPDEKGIETDSRRYESRDRCHNCKAHPDEKGIETVRKLPGSLLFRRIAKHIPTKRELKRLLAGGLGGLYVAGLQSSSRRKGN